MDTICLGALFRLSKPSSLLKKSSIDEYILHWHCILRSNFASKMQIDKIIWTFSTGCQGFWHKQRRSRSSVDVLSSLFSLWHVPTASSLYYT
jgi:hypothetical protein